MAQRRRKGQKTKRCGTDVNAKRFTDRLLYRKKYHVAKSLKLVSAKLRDETHLDALSEDLAE